MSEPKNDAAPADVQKPADEDLAGAVLKAVDAYNQALADATAACDNLETTIIAALAAARSGGIHVRFDSRIRSQWPSSYSGAAFTRTIEIVGKR